MLTGKADPQVLARRAPTLAGLATEALALKGVETLQILVEASCTDMEAHLPPALHPTVPLVVTWMVQRFPQSPWGPFQMAQTRIECRSGLRPRGFLVSGVVDNAEAQRELGARWGYNLQPGEIDLERGYAGIRVQVSVARAVVLEIGLRDPEPLQGRYIQYVANLHLAQTPRGLRLVQVDPDYEIERAERGRARIHRFEAGAWGDPALEPRYPVSASFTVADVTLPVIRYICRPDVLAFQGTERL